MASLQHVRHSDATALQYLRPFDLVNQAAGRLRAIRPIAGRLHACYLAPVLKLQTTPVVVPPSFTSSIRQ